METYDFEKDFQQLPILEAMIWHANKPYAMPYEEVQWRLFKQEYKCDKSAQQLLKDFRDTIMPNLENFQIIESYPEIADRLKSCPDRLTEQNNLMEAPVSTNPRIF